MFQRMEHISDPWRLHKSDVYMISILIFVTLLRRGVPAYREKRIIRAKVIQELETQVSNETGTLIIFSSNPWLSGPT